jgi:ParB-like chromosome segregation protein Spo0J
MNKIINPLITVKEDDKYKILAGNNRFLAGSELGYTEFPIKVKEKHHKILERQWKITFQ